MDSETQLMDSQTVPSTPTQTLWLGGLQEVFEQCGLSEEQVLDMDLEEWKEVERSVGRDLPFIVKMQMRNYFRQQGHFNTLTVRKSVHKVFDAEECVGTFVFISKDTGICALHCVMLEGEIRGESLTVQQHNLQLVRLFKKYDLAVFKVLGRQGEYLELEGNASIYTGCRVALASFPALDSQTQDDEEEEVIITYGRISRIKNFSELVMAQYPCFPNSSGGAVISESGKLLGLHLQSIYYVSHNHLGQDDKLEDQDTHKMALFAATNVPHKGLLGEVLPVSVIRRKLQHLGIVRAPRMRLPKEQGRKRRLLE